MRTLLHPMRHCFFCGQELGRYPDHDPLDNCGRAACRREAQLIEREERTAREERLDRDMGWSRW